MSQQPRARFPLQLTISGLFISLSVLLGVLLSIQNYNKTSDILLASAREVYDRLGEKLTLEMKATYRPIAGVLKMLAISPLTGADTLEQRLDHLQTMSIALDNHPAAANLQIAYANGDYFIVRQLNSAELRSRFKAPSDAVYMVDNIETTRYGTRSLSRLFFNSDRDVIAREPAVETEYDPRLRTWYMEASPDPVATKPYLFYFSRQVGVTAKIKADQPGVVIAADITLDRLADTINKYQITPSSEAVLINAEGQTFAYRDPDKLIISSDDNQTRLADLHQLGSDVLSYLSTDIEAIEQDLDFSYDNQQWIGRARVIAKPGGVDLFALMVSPVDELLSEASEIRTQSFIVTIIITLLFIPLIWYTARRISSSLLRLAGTASSISQFEFDTPAGIRSHIKEVNDLSTAMDLMQSTINRFIKLINSLASEQNLDALLHSISNETMLISNADGVLTYLMNEDETALIPGILCSRESDFIEPGQLSPISVSDDDEFAGLFTRTRSSIISVDSSTEAFSPLLRLFGTDHLTMIALPLTNRNFEHIGLLCLLFKQADTLSSETEKASLSFIQALSGFAAVTLESRQLLRMQEELLNSFIKLIAGAIDAKSRYTGGHCQRVPEITRMLAQAACDSSEAPFTDFTLSDKEWEALDIASWLHDCGKVTTPEYVVDKATKLETLYDRIHEVRMRFEVLKRDAEIDCWKNIADGGNAQQLKQDLATALRQLDDDFAFVAECNEGGEHMSEDRIQRLNDIAARTWTRTLDDSLGVSWEEAQRKSRSGTQAPPVEEPVLADKPEHIIEREPYEHMPSDNPWGFKLDVPEHKYNRGELYNLSVGRGTLSAEERYTINDHMTQTIIMLEKLPYPKHLRNVPKIAGGHHETMDGKGYPRRLTRDDMSLPARMMAIADIFEALTASDRPYKKAKTLSEAIRIMSFMRNDNHIDPDLFRLFLTSGVYEQYAREFLAPEQIDEVDINEYLART
jgi:HD-GYP domain-containing protein (c-di-GMP phosphodiesterase class II)